MASKYAINGIGRSDWSVHLRLDSTAVVLPFGRFISVSAVPIPFFAGQCEPRRRGYFSDAIIAPCQLEPQIVKWVCAV